MTVGRLLFIVFLLLTPTATGTIAAAAPGEIDFAALDAAIAAQMAKHGLPGAALAVVEGGGIVYLQGYGSAGRRAMTPQAPMFIGSQSKSFTALAVAQLAEHGKLDLNAPVQTYIPWFRVADEAASSQIMINHLLHHTSGLSESGHSVILPADATTEQAVRSLAQARLTAPVGTKHQYFNIGYDVLTYIIPTLILLIIFSQMRAFFGYRFNLGTNLIMMRYALPDVFVLMIVGTIPDYVQGSIKLGWTLRGKPATA